MKRKLSRPNALRAGAAALASVGFVRFPGDAAQWEYKASHAFPVTHPYHTRQLELWDAVRDETKGRLSVTTFPSSQLGGDAAVLGQLRSGAIQFAMEAGGVVGTIVPAASISDTGYAFKSAADGLAAMDGPLGDYVVKQVESSGIILYPAMYDVGMRQIASRTKPIASSDDFTGFKLRVQTSKIAIDLFTTLGASPTPMAFDAIYTSLQTRLIDGFDVDPVVFEAGKYYEVAKYMSMTNHMWIGVWLLGNAAVIGALPADVRTAILRNQRKYALLERKDVATLEETAKTKLQGLGTIYNDVPTAPMRAKLAPYYARWRAAFGETAWSLLEKAVGKLG